MVRQGGAGVKYPREFWAILGANAAGQIGMRLAFANNFFLGALIAGLGTLAAFIYLTHDKGYP